MPYAGVSETMGAWALCVCVRCVRAHRWRRLESVCIVSILDTRNHLAAARRANARVEAMPLEEAPTPSALPGWRAGQMLRPDLLDKQRAPEKIVARDAVEMLAAAEEAPEVTRLKKSEN